MQEEHGERQEVRTFLRSNDECSQGSHRRGGHWVCSVIDLVFVGVQGFGGVQVVAEVLHRLLHVLQLPGVRCGPSHQRSLWW